MCSHGVFHHGLGHRCTGGHDHTPTAGQNTRAAGIYSYEFCNAVVDCFESELATRAWMSFPVKRE